MAVNSPFIKSSSELVTYLGALKISKISFQGEARVIGSINGTKVPDELNQKLKEELARADQPVNLGKLIKELSSET